jgi:hypothetical protein
VVAMSESRRREITRTHPRSPARGNAAARGGKGDDVLRDVREKAATVAQQIVSGTSAVKEQVMRKAAEVSRAVADGVKEEAERMFDEQKGKIGTRVDRFEKIIHQAAHALHAVKADGVADVVDAAAERVGQASSYIEERTLSQLIADTEDVARRHTGLIAGGLFVTGLLAARFVKASASRGTEDNGSGGNARGGGRNGARGGKQERGGRGR